MILQWHMVKSLQLAHSPRKQKAETNSNYTELGVVGLPPSVTGAKSEFRTLCPLKPALKENVLLAAHPDTRGAGCRDQYQIKEASIQLSARFAHDLHLLFLADICAVFFNY